MLLCFLQDIYRFGLILMCWFVVFLFLIGLFCVLSLLYTHTYIRRMGDLRGAAGLPHVIEAIYVVWVIPEERMYHWFEPEFQEALQRSELESLGMPTLNLWVCFVVVFVVVFVRIVVGLFADLIVIVAVRRCM